MKGRNCVISLSMVLVFFQFQAILCQEKSQNPLPIQEAQQSWKMAEEQATSPEMISVPDGFTVDLVRSAVEGEGSWIALEFDDRNQLYVAKEDKGIFRFTLKESGDLVDPLLVNEDIEQCRGLLWAHDSLFVNSNNPMPPPMEVKEKADGLFRLRDLDGDGVFEDQVKLIETTQGSPGHGRNQLKLGPDGLIYFISGYDVFMSGKVDPNSFLRNYGEDQLIPNPWDEEWFNKHAKAPGGHLFRTDENGSFFQLVAGGFRNPMDVAFNRDGEIFTYDADMEWDAALPWYRPTRVIHVVSGADYGWRRATGKLPIYYEDSLPATVDIGLGSPTGVEFGYDSKFPGKWKEMLFAGDWTYGRILAINLSEKGASYTGTSETFASGRPMNVVDLTFGPDGHLYFVTGGMKTKSGIYRVRWTGPSEGLSETGTSNEPTAKLLRNLRYQLEFFQVIKSPKGAELALAYIDHPDRFVRHAARVALENQNPKDWVANALSSKTPAAMVALARGGEKFLKSGELLRQLNGIDLSKISNEEDLLGILRAYQLEFTRNESPEGTERSDAIANLSAIFPNTSIPVNHELTELLAFLQAPEALEELSQMIENAETTEDLSQYLVYSRYIEEGWDLESKRTFLRGVQRLESFPGGKFHQKIVDYLRNEMLGKLSEPEKTALSKWVKPFEPEVTENDEEVEPAMFVKAWEVDDFTKHFGKPLTGRDFDNGLKAYKKSNCVLCHKMEGNQASIKGILGPDLSNVGGRFGLRDLLVSIIHPSRAINDKYRNPAAPNLSTMPPGQINVLNEEEILDLLAYLQAGGREQDPVFSKVSEDEKSESVVEGPRNDGTAKVEEREFSSQMVGGNGPGESPIQPIDDLQSKPRIEIEPHYFESMSAVNFDDRERFYSELKSIIDEYPNATFELVGYADDSPYAQTNKEISANRARFTALNMIYRGIPREAITHRGAGLDPSSDRNKKVEVLVKFNDIENFDN